MNANFSDIHWRKRKRPPGVAKQGLKIEPLVSLYLIKNFGLKNFAHAD